MAVTTNGAKLKRDLGLNKFKYIWIRKALNTSIPIFEVTMDSRFPELYLSLAKVKKLKSLQIRKNVVKADEVEFKQYKYTPPIPLDEFSGSIPNNSIFIRHDIAGEHYDNPKMFDELNECLYVVNKNSIFV